MTAEVAPKKGRFLIHTVLGLSDKEADELSKKLFECYESGETMIDVLEAAAKGRVAADVMMGYNLASLFIANSEVKL